MRNFFLRLAKNLTMIYMLGFLVLSYRLIYNAFYFDFHKGEEVSWENLDGVYASGEIVGIYTVSDGVFVIDTCDIETPEGDFVNPAQNLVKTGDYILEINGTLLNEKEDMISAIQESYGESLTFTIWRNGKIKTQTLTPVLAKNGEYMLGIWIKDDLAGVGTLTYVTLDGECGALGHGMGNGQNEELLEVKDGDIYKSDIIGIQKGEKGQPGEVKGVIKYGETNHIAQVAKNSEKGIYGSLDEEDKARYQTGQYCAICQKQDISIGYAQIISDISGKKEYYDVEITYLDYLAVNSNKGIYIQVTDEKLLELTGGIVQGMSGSPIIQNGKIIGAVTHVLVNDPTRGYGIFIEEMLDAAG